MLPSYLKAVIFDMDGTLADNIPYHKQSWLDLLKCYNIAIDESDFDAQNHGTGPEMVRRFFGNNLSDEKVNELWKLKENLYRKLYTKHLKPIPGLTDLLVLLKSKNIRIGLATMGIAENVDFLLNGLGIKSYFNVITKGDEILKGKPDPEVYITTINKLKLRAEECLAVEDSLAGVLSAKNARLWVTAITTSSTAEYFTAHGVDSVVHDFKELMLQL